MCFSRRLSRALNCIRNHCCIYDPSCLVFKSKKYLSFFFEKKLRKDYAFKAQPQVPPMHDSDEFEAHGQELSHAEPFFPEQADVVPLFELHESIIFKLNAKTNPNIIGSLEAIFIFEKYEKPLAWL